MKYYIAMFRKDDMIDLYKFGQLYVYNHIVEYSGDLDRLEADTEFAEKKFLQSAILWITVLSITLWCWNVPQSQVWSRSIKFAEYIHLIWIPIN